MTAPDISDYRKIRRYVVGLIGRSGANPTRLPTVAELCESFSVSRPTVCKALKELSEQGYIISRRGIGSFTNPAKCNTLDGQRLPHVGLLLQDGMGVYLTRYFGGMAGELIKQLVSIPVIVQQINLGSVEPEIIQRDILTEKLDLLVCVGGVDHDRERCEQLRNSGLPVIFVSSSAPFPGSVRFNSEEWGYRCGKQLLAENRRNVVFMHDRPANNEPYRGIRRAFAEAKVQLNEEFFFEDSLNALQEIAKLLRSGVPIDAICNQMLGNNELPEMLVEVDPESPKRCAIIQCALSSQNVSGFREICFGIPFEIIAAETVRLVKQKLAGEAGYPDGISLELPLIIR